MALAYDTVRFGSGDAIALLTPNLSIVGWALQICARVAGLSVSNAHLTSNHL